ncbi:carboxypeptidase regulatory-like domain-containing protein [Paenibacillus albiflavus]|uniref:Carboxypeptidase regulatory-like domain-containing protein n=1 Tax=Paenibacillus albiflavus TaxID=2545760 RepID=A0A4R4E7K5_9BACL|nr:carboxypeptidase-like regulatory domain-containing protein [Paenibacillus albiflavus]TCZ74041.1 carboxypeptidase regulatory-like domain-containing protein [Paenibacillus albiflavus]
MKKIISRKFLTLFMVFTMVFAMIPNTMTSVFASDDVAITSEEIIPEQPSDEVNESITESTIERMNAPDVIIGGTVHNQQIPSSPIAGAKIMLKKGKTTIQSVTTAADGTFAFTGAIADGYYNLYAEQSVSGWYGKKFISTQMLEVRNGEFFIKGAQVTEIPTIHLGSKSSVLQMNDFIVAADGLNELFDGNDYTAEDAAFNGIVSFELSAMMHIILRIMSLKK